MSQRLLNSHKHFCFHTPRANVHQHPDLHRCNKGAAHAQAIAINATRDSGTEHCSGSIHVDMATQAGLVDDAGNVLCPLCEGPTTLVQGEKKAEIHALLCTDETIHYPKMHKAGTLSDADYATWKATLTRAELLGHYKRVADIPVMAKFSHDETALMETDLAAFNVLLTTRLHEAAESALLHQVPYRHKTTQPNIALEQSKPLPHNHSGALP
jgi:hypothetical protein